MPIYVNGATTLLTVYDVPTSLAFYRDILGFEVINHSQPFSSAKDDFGWCLLRLNNVDLMLNNMFEDNIRPSAPDPARTQAHSDTCIYILCPDLDTAYTHLQQYGVACNPPKVSYYGMRQLYFPDPDGYSLCLQHPSS